jgi:hypothetical protein
MVAASGGRYVAGLRADPDSLSRGMMVIGIAAFAASLITGGPPGALGFVCGVALVWMSRRSIEMAVRWSIRAAAPWRGVLLTLMFVLKLPLLVCIVGSAAWLIANQIVSPFALVGGMVFAEGFLVTKRARALSPSRPSTKTLTTGSAVWHRRPSALADAVPRRARAALSTRHGLFSHMGLLPALTTRHAGPRAREG